MFDVCCKKQEQTKFCTEPFACFLSPTGNRHNSAQGKCAGEALSDNFDYSTCKGSTAFLQHRETLLKIQTWFYVVHVSKYPGTPTRVCDSSLLRLLYKQRTKILPGIRAGDTRQRSWEKIDHLRNDESVV
jgi:hypothetical protein